MILSMSDLNKHITFYNFISYSLNVYVNNENIVIIYSFFYCLAFIN